MHHDFRFIYPPLCSQGVNKSIISNIYISTIPRLAIIMHCDFSCIYTLCRRGVIKLIIISTKYPQASYNYVLWFLIYSSFSLQAENKSINYHWYLNTQYPPASYIYSSSYKIVYLELWFIHLLPHRWGENKSTIIINLMNWHNLLYRQEINAS